MRTHGALSEDSRSYRMVTHDRKGREGKGDRKGSCLRMLHRLTGPSHRPVDNSLASATTAHGFDVACDAFGGDPGLS